MEFLCFTLQTDFLGKVLENLLQKEIVNKFYNKQFLASRVL